MMIKRDEIIFLLGAGASSDAGILTSCGMIDSLEQLLNSDEHWKTYLPLYNYIKSSIVYAEGIHGNFDNSNFNIERLVNTLDELLKSDKHPIFPFIGSWNPKLPEISGSKFSELQYFREKIVEQLSRHWVQLEYINKADYYIGLSKFQKEYQHPLRIFTLNYDLCVEKACINDGVERGFGDEKQWDWKIFDNEAQINKNIFLYKLHGSIDWTRDNKNNLIYKDGNISPEKIEIIFGTTYKLQYVDPFLYFAYEFRKRTLSEAKIIVCVGYGFADDHINGIISQSLNNNNERKLLSISSESKDKHIDRIKKVLKINLIDNIHHMNISAKEFFEDKLSLDVLNKIFPEEAAPFKEIVK